MPKLSLLGILLVSGWAIPSSAEVPTGPAIGQMVEDFQAVDQNGTQHTLKSILGPKGALLVFYRSADW